MHPTAGPDIPECPALPAATEANWERTGSTGVALAGPRGSVQQPRVPNEWDLHCVGAGGPSLICNLRACHMSLQRGFQQRVKGDGAWLAGQKETGLKEPRTPSKSIWVDKTPPFLPLSGRAGQ